jgi:hypothetical protein
VHHGQRRASRVSPSVRGNASDLRRSMRRQLAESVQLPWKRNRVWGCIVQRGSGGKYSVGLQWGRRLLREQRGSMRLGQVLHRRRLRGSDYQRQFLPEQQSMFERKLFE